MKLSKPPYRLKRQARVLSRAEGTPLHNALDEVARREGYGSWSLLAAHQPQTSPSKAVFDQLLSGDFVLVAARPGQGKTAFALELCAHAIKAGHNGALFTLEYTLGDVARRFQALGIRLADIAPRFLFDDSDDICADHIASRLTRADPGTLVVVDYLQLLDQKRRHPMLADQVRLLRQLAADRGFVIIALSQVDRSYEETGKTFPDIADLRMPNPFDPKVFTKTCFLNAGAVRFEPV